MTRATPDAGRAPLRVARAVVLACVATAVGAGSHLCSGGALGPGVVGAVPVLALLAWPLTARERDWWTIAGVQLAGQHAAHALFGLGVPSHVAGTAAVPVDAWFYGHLLAAVALATWLRHAERRTWHAARRAVATLAAHWRRLVAQLPGQPGTAPSPVVVAAAGPPAALRRRALRHSVLRRGPPVLV